MKITLPWYVPGDHPPAQVTRALGFTLITSWAGRDLWSWTVCLGAWNGLRKTLAAGMAKTRVAAELEALEAAELLAGIRL